MVALDHWLGFELLGLCRMELINAIFFDSNQ